MAWSYVGLLAATGTEITVRLMQWSLCRLWRRPPSRSRFWVVHLCSFWNDGPSYGLAVGGLTNEWSRRALGPDGARLIRRRWADRINFRAGPADGSQY